MHIRTAVLVLAFLLAGQSAAQQSNVSFVGDFESGRIRSAGDRHDGFYLATVPNPQTGSEVLTSGQSDFGPDSRADTRVVASESVGGEIVSPRKGQYFLRSEVFRTKDYMRLNEYVKNKPRSKMYLSAPQHRIDFDEEGYAGFSIYVPRNFEHELGVRDHRGDSMLFEMASDSSRTLLNLGVWVEAPNTEAHWYLRTWTSDSSVKDGQAKAERIDLGPVSADMGKWTDFVVRYRFNPFSVTTNPAAKGIAEARDRQYQGNKGILQIWKAEGAVDRNGDRQMKLKVDRVNTPVGLVPHASDRIKHLWRIYKYGWTSNPTTLTRPVWFGFDEIRQGLVERDGTTFAAVAPSNVACQSNCGGEQGVVEPLPPTSLSVD